MTPTAELVIHRDSFKSGTRVTARHGLYRPDLASIDRRGGQPVEGWLKLTDLGTVFPRCI